MIEIFISSAFIYNIVLTYAVGAEVIIHSPKKKERYLDFTVTIAILTLICGTLAYFPDKLFENFKYYSIVRPLSYILIISVIYTAGLLFLWRFFEKLFIKIRPYIHLSAFSGAVLGSILILGELASNILEYALASLGASTGFAFGYLLYIIAEDSLKNENIPKPFRGFPITLMFFGIISLAFSTLI